MTLLDAGLIAVICALLSSVVTSVIWSHAAFMRYAELNSRLSIMETKMDVLIARHEAVCENFKPRTFMG